MTRTALTRVAGAASLALGLSLALGMPAQAKGGDASTHGSCSATSTYKVLATGHKDTIRVKAQVKTDAAGELWTFDVSDNGSSVATGDGTTAKNGKLKVKASIPNLEGTDTIGFTATDSVTGETCTAEVAFAG